MKKETDRDLGSGLRSNMIVNVESPNPALTFYGAVKSMMAGNRVTRVEWNNSNIYGQLKDGVLQLHKEDGFYNWIVNEGDIISEDWVLVVP